MPILEYNGTKYEITKEEAERIKKIAQVIERVKNSLVPVYLDGRRYEVPLSTISMLLQKKKKRIGLPIRRPIERESLPLEKPRLPPPWRKTPPPVKLPPVEPSPRKEVTPGKERKLAACL